MKILLLGANGRTGREILNRALRAGDSVTALVRSEDRLADITHSQLSVHVGNVCDSNDLKKIISGHDLVISTLGPRLPTKAACTIYSDSAKAIVDAMQDCGVKRLLVTSTALLFPTNKLLDRILRFVARHSARNASLMEETIRASSLEWTIARLGFLNDKTSIDYRQAEGALPEGGGAISRAAVANFLLSEAKQPVHVHNVVGISNK
ncbi:NAD(P)-dependent oxidoreductase [Vibrio brasiliensis]|uniref:NAD(P)-dependent oxidoreductase n=1 Tax=Vibrio brasiliensis TaxID=170652 RepID=UPI001EFC64BC|nr:NAD(P)H-binding protein [Vibrio brasiliensis]MCG9727546.1 NAD(P)H-binding protein [Vibrio brasiliensis]